MEKQAIVVLSGGQDSTTVLFDAIHRYGADRIGAVTFDYGQRHRSEIEAAKEIADLAGVEHDVLPVPALGAAAISALTRPDVEVQASGGLGGLPSTFTPNRNMVFIALAASYAISRGCHRLILGVCQTDFSGYPDCRREFIDLAERAVAVGNGLSAFEIETPLMWLTKAQTVAMMDAFGELAMRALGRSVTCYHGQRPGCGTCPACLLRAKGFEGAGIADPAR